MVYLPPHKVSDSMGACCLGGRKHRCRHGRVRFGGDRLPIRSNQIVANGSPPKLRFYGPDMGANLGGMGECIPPNNSAASPPMFSCPTSAN